MTTTHQVFGMDLPIISELSSGWLLVAHKNGPAIAHRDRSCLSALECDFESVPNEIREAATRAYREFSWPLVRGEFFPKNED